MRVPKMLLAPAMALTVATSVPAIASAATVEPVAVTVQDAKVDISVNENDSGPWYLSPVWLAIGGLAVLVIIMIAVMAGRGGKSNTTVVK